MSVSESKRYEVFRRAEGRCRCTLVRCGHPIDHREALQRASGTIAVGPIGAALLTLAASQFLVVLDQLLDRENVVDGGAQNMCRSGLT